MMPIAHSSRDDQKAGEGRGVELSEERTLKRRV